MDIHIAWRNLWRNPRRTAIILTAVVIGISSMVLLSALMRGMTEGMVENAVDNLVGNIRIQDPEFSMDPSIDKRITNPDEIKQILSRNLPLRSRVTARIKVDAMLSTSREHLGVMMVGIDPDEEEGVSFIADSVVEGRMIGADEKNGLLVGKALADRIGAELGRKVVLMSRSREHGNESRAFRIRGIYKTELAATEKQYVLVPLASLQQMLGIGNGVTELAITVDSKERIVELDLSAITETLNRELAQYGLSARSWREILPMMSNYLEMFNGYMLIWFVVVFIAMGFGLVNTMLMAVYERMREFGLLRAIGMRSGTVVRMVMTEMLLLLVIGAVIANCGAFFLLYLLRSGIDISVFAHGTEMWGISRIIMPVVSCWDVYAANGVVLFLGMIVGMYPAGKAARFTPVETMRHL